VLGDFVIFELRRSDTTEALNQYGQVPFLSCINPILNVCFEPPDAAQTDVMLSRESPGNDGSVDCGAG